MRGLGHVLEHSMNQAQGSTASTARLCSSSRTHAGHVPCPPLAARLSLSQRQGHFLRSAADSKTFTLRPPTRRPGASASGGHSSSSNNSSSGSATLAPVKFGGGGGGGNLSGSGRWLLPARSGLAASHLHNGSGGGQLPRTRRMVLLSAAAPAAEAAAEAGEAEVSVAFDNDGDDECTVLELFGRNDTEVLAEVTNVLTAVGVTVASAVINQQDGEGPVRDVFRVTDCNGNKLTPEQWPVLKQQLLVALAGTVRSTKPSIFGMLAAADQASTLSALSNSGDPDALEHAAAEMSKAAARLVAIERNMLELSADDGADVAAMATKQKDRIEAASLLERTLAAMEAMLTARRQVAIKAVEAVKPVVPDFMQPPPSVRTSGPAAGSGYEIILQGFNWESSKEAWYKKLSGQAADIAEAGFTAIWFPPPSDSVAPQGYLPRDLYDLNSKFGSEAELRDAISVFHEQGIKVIADIVINHRCAHYQGDDGKWNKFGGRLAWDKSAVCANNAAFGGTGGYKNADDYPAAPNIDHSQERIRKDISEWLLYLRKSIGFDGWRFDYTKGYDGRWIAEYVNATVPEMAFGEYWDTCSYTDGVLNYNQDSHRQRTVDWCDATGGTSAAFDFTLKGVLQEAVGRKEYWRLIDGQGRPPGVLGLWPSRAVTFLENHDTGSTLNHWPFPYRNLPEAYCYLLTHCGTPCVFYDHFYDSKLRTHILELVAIRRRHKIHAKSEIMVRKAYGELYAAIIDKKIAMKIGPGDWSPSKDGMDIGQKKWQLAHSGFQFAVWEAKFE